MIEKKLKLLGYNKLWIDLSILTPDFLQSQIQDFKNSDDKNTEHYRYSAFKKWLSARTLITDDLINKLFEIIKVDKDISMASAMAIDILKLKTLTELQFKLVSGLIIHVFGDEMQKYIDLEEKWRQKRKES